MYYFPFGSDGIFTKTYVLLDSFFPFNQRNAFVRWLTRGGVQFVVMQWKRKMVPIEDPIHDLDLLANKLT